MTIGNFEHGFISDENSKLRDDLKTANAANERLREVVRKQTENLKFLEQIQNPCWYCGANSWASEDHKSNCKYDQAIRLGEDALKEGK
jgi:hypothetical protein